MRYTVVVKSARPSDLARKIAKAHAESIAQRSTYGLAKSGAKRQPPPAK